MSTEFAVSLVGLVGVGISTVGAYWARRAHNHARAADRAVNGIPDGQPRIYDLVVETRDDVRHVGARLDHHIDHHP